MLITTDGGATATRRCLPYLPASEWQYAESFVLDVHHGWVAGGSGENDGIFTTNDEGRTWLPGRVPSGILVGALAFTDTSSGWAVGEHKARPTSDAAGALAVLHTTDGGATWNEQVVPHIPERPGTGPDEHFASVSAFRDGTVWVGSPYEVIKTTNGGTIWERVDAPSPGAIDFIDAQVGWIHTNSDLFATTDGGATWRDELLPKPTFIYDMSFVDSLHGWVTGVVQEVPQSHSVLYRTDDGGKTFVVLETDAGKLNVLFVDQTHGWAGFWQGSGFSYTVDGGRTWSYGDSNPPPATSN